MSTKKVLNLLQRGWTALVDPDREERLQRGVALVHRALSEQRDNFNLEATLARHQIDEADRDEIARRIYQKCVTKAWSDTELSSKELRTLEWVAQHLRLSGQETARILREQAETVFASILAQAFQDGILDDAEFTQLTHVATVAGSTVTEFFRTRFREQGEGFLRSLFFRVLENGTLDQTNWSRITKTVSRLGLSQDEFHAVVQEPAQQWAEHLLADFKSDGDISPEEENYLKWVLTHFLAEGDFSRYVREEIVVVQQRARIRQGLLPSLPAPHGLAIKAGELVHFAGDCRFVSARRRPDGRAAKITNGSGVITDNRFIFTSEDHSQQISHTKVLGFQRERNGLEIQCSGSAAGLYTLPSAHGFGPAIWIAAIQKANQTLVAPRDQADSRHIPRDVRQRVWQRYGGKCADCGSTHYLEFDHIIPVARGGGNSDNNVQLLCRGCNGRKSDKI
jgi:hypothetical protein